MALEKQAIRLQTQWVVQDEWRERVIDMIKIQKQFDLSRREAEVVKYLCRGDTNKGIAERLFISKLTVKGHVRKIYQKMGVHNRATLVSKILL